MVSPTNPSPVLTSDLAGKIGEDSRAPDPGRVHLLGVDERRLSPLNGLRRAPLGDKGALHLACRTRTDGALVGVGGLV